MDQTLFMGLLIGAIVVLLGIAGGIATLIVKPIINLNNSITKLNASIDQLNGANKTLNERVTKHGKEIDTLRLNDIKQEKEIEHLKEKIK